MTALELEPDTLAEQLAWGYTMADVERIARFAARQASRRIGGWLGWTEQLEFAWFGVVEALLSSGRAEAPEFLDLLSTAHAAVVKEADARMRHSGKNRDGSRRPSFQRYWQADEAPTRPGAIRSPGRRFGDDLADSVVERLSLPALLDVLTERERQVVMAMAAHDSRAAAAASLGLPYGTFSNNLARARVKCLQACLGDDETPGRIGKGAPARGRREGECRAGHSRSEHGYLGPAGGWMCRLCVRAAARRRAARKRS